MVMDQARPQHRFVVPAACALVVVVLVVAWLRHDPYSSAKGVRGVPEFIGQPLSFAVSRLGAPARSFEFTVAAAGEEGMPRRNVTNLEPALAPDMRVREVSWDKGQTFVTVWYRAEPGHEVGVDAVQWDKRLTVWAETMATPPVASTRTAP
jgi:hypothetical protein